MASYEHTTRAQFRTKVYERLGETGVFWPEEEINSSIEEALLTFGAISNFWREEIFFETEENIRLYNLFSDVIRGFEFIFPTYTYQKIIDWINKDLLETISVTTPISEFLSLDELLKSIETKYNLFQQLVSLVINQIDIPAPPTQNIILLPDHLIDIVRITFVDDDGNKTILNRSDEAELSYFDSDSLENNKTPIYYATTFDKTKTIKIYPAPNINGFLEVLFVVGRDNSTPLDVENVIDLPNNLVPYIKYGVEMDIFGKEGVTQDLIRMAYCKQRWEEGIAIGLHYNSVLLAKANGKMILTDSMTNVDLFMDAIKIRTPPTVLGFAGYNLFETDITPSSEVASLGLLVVANAKIPLTDDDFIRVDLEYINTLIDYVVHLSKIKTGAAELAQSNELKDNFIKVSISHNDRLQFRGLTYEALIGTTKKEEQANPRVVK